MVAVAVVMAGVAVVMAGVAGGMAGVAMALVVSEVTGEGGTTMAAHTIMGTMPVGGAAATIAGSVHTTDGAALILAGEPVNNRRLAELMDCSPGEASRRVAQLEGVIRKARKGREVLISLH